MEQTDHEAAAGPWIYEDPDGRRYLVQVVPMERDPTIDEGRQPKAVVFQTDEGWIRVSPVGHDFSPERLTRDQIQSILQFAAGRPEETPDP